MRRKIKFEEIREGDTIEVVHTVTVGRKKSLYVSENNTQENQYFETEYIPGSVSGSNKKAEYFLVKREPEHWPPQNDDVWVKDSGFHWHYLGRSLYSENGVDFTPDSVLLAHPDIKLKYRKIT